MDVAKRCLFFIFCPLLNYLYWLTCSQTSYLLPCPSTSIMVKSQIITGFYVLEDAIKIFWLFCMGDFSFEHMWLRYRGGISFTEGPAVDAEGNIFFTDQSDDVVSKKGYMRFIDEAGEYYLYQHSDKNIIKLPHESKDYIGVC